MPSRDRNFYSLLRLKLLSRSPLWLGNNIVAFHPGGPSLIQDILIYALFLFVKVISSIIFSFICGPGGSSGKAFGYGLDGPGSIPGVGGVQIFLHSFVSRLALRSTQPPIK